MKGKRYSTVPVTVVLAAMMLCFCLASCGGEAARDEGEVEGGTLRTCVIGDPASLDPTRLEDVEDIRIAGLIFDGLMRRDPETLELEPAMARYCDISEDATVFTFHLRRDVGFQNGRRCTAEDFVYSWNRLCDPDIGGGAAHHLEAVKGYEEVTGGRTAELEGVKALDEYTLEVALSYPHAEFASYTAHPALSPVPREVVEEYGSESFGDHPVGTGPFEFVEWRHLDRVELRRNPDYYGDEKPRLDGLIFGIYPDREAAFLEFVAGALDESPVPPQLLSSAEDDYGDLVVTVNVPGLYYLGFNLNTEPWRSSRLLRQALNYAIDKGVLSEAVMEGACREAVGIVPPGTVGYQADACDYGYDPVRAAELVAEAGYPNGGGLPAITLCYPVGEVWEEIAGVLREDLAGLGLEVLTEGYTEDTYTNLIANDRISLFVMEFRPYYPIMDAYLAPLFYPYNTSEDWFKYSSPEVDDIISQARGMVEEGLRLELYRGAERLVLEDASLVPLMFGTRSRVHAERVGGYLLTATDYIPYELVYLER
ncbi:MAG: ABC transporter substrate-binding protein [Actinomycetota bacterium]|nr:ABC transporter substrate-binding protein [Actinomycetota bacterium]